MGHEDRGSWDWEQIPQPPEPKELKVLKEMTAASPCEHKHTLPPNRWSPKAYCMECGKDLP